MQKEAENAQKNPPSDAKPALLGRLDRLQRLHESLSETRFRERLLASAKQQYRDTAALKSKALAGRKSLAQTADFLPLLSQNLRSKFCEEREGRKLGDLRRQLGEAELQMAEERAAPPRVELIAPQLMRYFGEGYNPVRAFDDMCLAAPRPPALEGRSPARPSAEFVLCKNAPFVANLAPFLCGFLRQNEDEIVESVLEELLDEEVETLNALERRGLAAWEATERPAPPFHSEDPNLELVFEMYKKLERLL